MTGRGVGFSLFLLTMVPIAPPTVCHPVVEIRCRGDEPCEVRNGYAPSGCWRDPLDATFPAKRERERIEP